MEDGRGEADVRPRAGVGVAGAEAGEEEASSPGVYLLSKKTCKEGFIRDYYCMM